MSDSAPPADSGRSDQGFVLPRLPRSVRIIPLAPEAPGAVLLERFSDALSGRLGIPVRVDAPLAVEPLWWSPERSQLSSNDIIDTLVARYPLAAGPPVAEWVLALTAADLRGGRRDFVFGEAAVGGAWAVVSIARFGAAGPVLEERLLKEALHELGHVAGLEHCSTVECVMLHSIDVAAVDAKGIGLCGICAGRWHGG